MRFLHSLTQIKMQEYEHIIIYYIGKEGRKKKAKLRQHEQRTSGDARAQLLPLGARTVNAGQSRRFSQYEQ